MTPVALPTPRLAASDMNASGEPTPLGPSTEWDASSGTATAGSIRGTATPTFGTTYRAEPADTPNPGLPPHAVVQGDDFVVTLVPDGADGATGGTTAGSASPSGSAPAREALEATPAKIPTPDLPPATYLDGVRHSYQTWNNCGPATVDMALSAWDVAAGQADAATRLKPDPDDKNVSPEELVRYVREMGLDARVIHGGRLETLKALVARGIPTIVETWFIPEPGDEMGHYRLVVGYDDEAGVMIAHDSYNGPDLRIPYSEFDERWRVFDRLYIPVMPPERVPEVARICGRAFDDPQAMWTNAAARALQEIEERGDAFAHFNLGTALVGMGEHARAADAFDRARGEGLPWRMLWYQFGPFEAYGALGRWDDVRALTDANLSNAPNLEESLYWRARARQAAGDIAGARSDAAAAGRFNPLFGPARTLLDALNAP